MDRFMDRLILFSMIGIVVASVWLLTDAMITFNSLDLAKIIGG